MNVCSNCGGYQCVFCNGRMSALEGPGHILKEHADRLLFAASHNPFAFHFFIHENAPRCIQCNTILYDYGKCLNCSAQRYGQDANRVARAPVYKECPTQEKTSDEA